MLTILSAPRLAFSPVSMGGLVLWLDASDQGSLSLSSGAVATWYDKSGGGRNFTQATAGARPLWNIAGIATGYPGVTFDGVDDYLSRSGSIMYNAGACTVYMVVRAPSMGLSMFVLSEGSTASATPVYALHRSATGTASTSSVLYTTDAAANVLNGTTSVGASFDTTTRITCRIDDGANVYGRRGGVAVVGPTNYARAATTLDICVIGGRAKLVPDTFAPFTLAEILIFNRVLETRELQQVEGYLKRWGATITQGDHPYNTAGFVP